MTTISACEQEAPEGDLPDSFPMTNTEAKALWLAALRSGQYTQGRGQLFQRATNAYCCLGVACDVYHLETGRGEWDSLGSFSATPDGARFSGTLPPQVRDWFGLAEADPVVAGMHLTEANDSAGKTFDEIAALIEAAL